MELKIYRADVQIDAHAKLGIQMSDEEAQQFIRDCGGLVEQAALKRARESMLAELGMWLELRKERHGVPQDGK